MSSFIELPMNIDDVQEDKPVPEGEYTLVITDVKEKNNEDGSLKNLLVICEIQGHDGAANVLHNISMPQPADDAEKVTNKMKFIKRFISLFNIKTDGGKLNLQNFPGAKAKAMLTLEEYQGNVSNKIKLPAAK